jgi:hypothetical protein
MHMAASTLCRLAAETGERLSDVFLKASSHPTTLSSCSTRYRRALKRSN